MKDLTFNQRHYIAYDKEYFALDSNYKNYIFTTVTYIPELSITINKKNYDERSIGEVN